MTQKTINLGTADQGNGDPLRVAFGKVNDNFTELYTALGLNVGGLNLGAFEFTGSVISTTDSSAIVIDQAVTVSSNLTVGGDVLPSVANGGDLGSSARPWRSLYVSNNTIFIGGTAVGVDANGNLTVNGSQVTGGSVSSLVNGAKTVGLGSTGILTLPNGAAIRDTTGDAVAFGLNAGQNTQGIGAVAIGALAGQITQGTGAVAIGETAGQSAQGIETVAIGYSAGFTTQGNSAVAIGSGAGAINQGYSAIAIGRLAGRTNQGNNSIIMNATDADLDQTTANTFTVAPIRNIGGTSGVLQYNATTKEITYSSDITSEGNINIDINLSDSTLRRWQFGEDGALTFPDGTNYAGKDITLPQTYGGVASKVSWNFSDIVFGNSTTFLEWNLLSTDLGEFLIGTSSAATSFYFSFDGSGQTLGTIDNGGIVGGGKLTFGSTAGSNAGDVNAIELKATNGDVYLTSTESVKITVDASDSSARVWLFDPTGNLTFPDASVQTTAYTGLTPNSTKASNDTGTAGQTSYDSQYFYVCVATNLWYRTALIAY